jgi:hypothetical protein
MITLEYLTGHKKLKLIPPNLIEGTEIKGWWIFKREVKVWYIIWEFCIQGPFYNQRFASEMFGYALLSYKGMNDTTIEEGV